MIVKISIIPMFITLCYLINLHINNKSELSNLSRMRRETGENEMTINSGRPSIQQDKKSQKS